MHTEPSIRKSGVVIESTRREGGRQVAEGPWEIACGIVVLDDPWEGGFLSSPGPLEPEYAEAVAEELTEMVLRATGWSPATVMAVGMGLLHGTDLVIEQGAGIVHTGVFGGVVRRAVHGTAGVVSVDKRGGPGTTLDVPLKHKDDHAQAPFHMTLPIWMSDAPRANELLIGLGMAITPRPFAGLARP